MKSGTTLAGRYIIREVGLRTVGGDFYLAQDVGSGLLVSVQTIPALVSTDGQWMADLRRNFLLLHTLDHPHIAKMHALEYDPELRLHFLVREHAFGVDLLEYRLSRPGQRVAIESAVAICRQIADALDHAHRSLLHRDIRPEHVILTPEGYVKLWNFDLIPAEARQALRMADPGAAALSTSKRGCYRAPEQGSGQLSLSPATDLWALAVLFYELVTGELPFKAAAPLPHDCTPPPVKRLGRRRNQVLARAFASNPSQRFPSATAFVEGLESVWWPRSVAEIRKTVTVTLLGVSLLTLLGWGVLVQRLPHKPDPPPPAPEASRETMALTPDLKKSLLLQIESRPTDATVVLDGKRLGSTPFTVGRVAPGAYHLWLEKPGYKPVDMEIDLTQDTIVSMNLDLSDPAEEMEPIVTEQKKQNSDGAQPPPATASSGSGRSLSAVAADQPVVNEPLAVQSAPEPAPSSSPSTATSASSPSAVAPVSSPSTVTPVLSPPNPTPVPKTAAELAVASLPMEVAVNGAAAVPAVGGREGVEAPSSGSEPAALPSPSSPPVVASRATLDAAALARIEALLQEARSDIQSARLTLPRGRNAAEKYRAVLRADPENGAARQGLTQIANQLVVMANEGIKAGYLTQPSGRNACDKLLAALAVDPQHPEIGKSIGKMVARYLPLAKSGEKAPKALITLLDQAAVALPQDADIAAARKALSLPAEPPTESVHSQGGDEVESRHFLSIADSSQSVMLQSQPLRLAAESARHPLMLADGTASMTTISQPDQSDLKTWREPVTGMLFVWIEKGCFQMGSGQGDGDEVPVHRVCLDGFWMGRHEVTQGAWQQVMVEANPARFQKGLSYPLDSVSWEDAQRFIQRLNAKGGERFRLPTEAEWEYGCRAGSQSPFHFGNSIHAGKANFNGERNFGDGPKGHYVGSTLPVGSFPANHFGLFDMHGNLAEWVADPYRPDFYQTASQHNPVATAVAGEQKGPVRYGVRGGAWYSTPQALRCAARYWGEANARDHGQGFRLLRVGGAP
ncbi:MAG: SUMF1/EgtB/PvdO family nonheme iron enzyme [Magnetococcales bacterium]|nr:SUMF1/EgtB/PvdO family nonheme iron enzyme [Magnetococcales bacterium]